MADAKHFRRERYADLQPIIDKAIGLEKGKSLLVLCEGKSPHTVGQKIREFFKLAAEQRPDADAIKIYANAYNRDPNFYEFLKTLETYEKTIDKKNTIIMTTDSDYYKFLKSVE